MRGTVVPGERTRLGPGQGINGAPVVGVPATYRTVADEGETSDVNGRPLFGKGRLGPCGTATCEGTAVMGVAM